MTRSIIRISIMLALAAIGIAGLATISTGNLSSSIVLFIFSKATAAVCFYYISSSTAAGRALINGLQHTTAGAVEDSTSDRANPL